jgi:glycosyltransferase involved in cell wall biosynthesis
VSSPDPSTPVEGRVSIVVPTRNSARTIEAALHSARAQRGPDVEVIVIDNHSSDATLTIAGDLADRVETWGPERSAQRNRGAAIATGEFLLFLDSDMVLDSAVAAEAGSVFEDRPDIGAVVIPELGTGEGFWSACRSLEKRLYLGSDDVEAPRVFRRATFEALGGFDESLTAAEDWELADRVRDAGWRCGRVSSCVWHDEGRVRLRATFRKKRYYGRWVSDYLSRRPDRCGRRLSRTSVLAQPRELLRSPLLTVGLGVLKAVEGAGLVVGMVAARHQDRP